MGNLKMYKIGHADPRLLEGKDQGMYNTEPGAWHSFLLPLGGPCLESAKELHYRDKGFYAELVSAND